jgi:2-iminobutanoate/2-iminopropanoate deaminase
MAARSFISTGPGLPRWANPTSHAVVVNDTCYVSGQLSVNEAGAYVAGSAEEEARRAFANVLAALSAAGFSIGEIVYVDIAFADLSDQAGVDRVYAELFPAGRRPARTIYQAAALPFGGKVKVVATAVRESPVRGQ